MCTKCKWRGVRGIILIDWKENYFEDRSRSVGAHNLTDDVVDDALSDKLRQAMLLAEVVLHEKALLLAAALPRRRREEEDNMVNSLWNGVALFFVGWSDGFRFSYSHSFRSFLSFS